MKQLMTVLLALTIVAPLSGWASQVAKAIIVKGKVLALLPNEKTPINVEKNNSFPEGTVLQTADKSFVKLLFIDKSQMNIRPQSKITIESFDKKEPGVINLIKGELRAKVTKNYMEMDKDKSKLFIKTKTAAMGIRGTEFQVNFNPVTSATSLLTFSGAVAFSKIDIKNPVSLSNRNHLEKIVSSETAVIVKKGEFSGVQPDSAKASEPVKVDPVQLQQLKAVDLSMEVSSPEGEGESEDKDKGEKQESKEKSQEEGSADKKDQEKKKVAVRSVLPPGVNKSEFSAPKSDLISAATNGGSSGNRSPASETEVIKPELQPVFKINLDEGTSALASPEIVSFDGSSINNVTADEPVTISDADLAQANDLQEDILDDYNNTPPPPISDSFGQVHFKFILTP